MDHLQTALANAANGWPQHPVRHNKTPYLNDWEHTATTSAEAISVWGTIDHPGCLWATTPGRVGVTVIDIDAHPDKPSGYISLATFGLPVSTPHLYRSLSGNGEHAWYRGRSSSRNALYPGIDRKSVGGYVITPYLMPPVASITTRLPESFHGFNSTDDALHPFHGHVAEWLAERSGLSPAQRVRTVVKEVAREEFRGHENMLRKQARLVHLGREGHGGVPEALAELRDMWLSAEHGRNEDPAKEWQIALVRAVRNYGGEAVDAGTELAVAAERSGTGARGRGKAAGKDPAYARHGVAEEGWGDLVAPQQ